MDRTYIAIDLKSFYASVECVERKLDPLGVNLVVADESRTDKTICLAVSPSLKAYGVPGRPRLFEVIQKVKEINDARRRQAPNRELAGTSPFASELASHPSLALSYIVAPPQMSHYLAVSTQIYRIYLRYIAPEDIHVYSIDEVFIDATPYLPLYHLTAHELALRLVREVLKETGITATAGIGTNLYLCKIAMDILAKKMPADKDGVRIADLDEMTYREKLWEHRPLTDFWRIGKGIQRKLEACGIYTMGDIAFTSLFNEEQLYKLFGVNAELLIDHAWGYEPCTMQEIKSYRPESNSLSSGQVLQKPYPFEKARIIVREMAEELALRLVEHDMVTNQIVLSIGYDRESLTRNSGYNGPVVKDYYGRNVPKEAHGSKNLSGFSSSSKELMEETAALFDEIVDPKLWIRQIHVTGSHVILKKDIPKNKAPEQLSFFVDYKKIQDEKKRVDAQKEKEHKMQFTVLQLKERYGKNAVLRAVDYIEDATTINRNNQIGGHKA